MVILGLYWVEIGFILGLYWGLGLYWVSIGLILVLYWGYIEIMEKNMENYFGHWARVYKGDLRFSALLQLFAKFIKHCPLYSAYNIRASALLLPPLWFPLLT